MRTREPRRTQILREHLTLPPFSAPPPTPVLPPPVTIPPLNQGLSSEILGAPLDAPPLQDPQPQRLSRCRVEDGMRPPQGHVPTPGPATVPSPQLPPPLPPVPPLSNHHGLVTVTGTSPWLPVWTTQSLPLSVCQRHAQTHTKIQRIVSESICLTVKLFAHRSSYAFSMSPAGFSL